MIDEILAEREQTYGSFRAVASLSQELKRVAQGGTNYRFMSVDQREALDMIFSKLARILNGDANHLDSWVDIGGYSQLVAKRLEKQSG